jgi:hypothetical protein
VRRRLDCLFSLMLSLELLDCSWAIEACPPAAPSTSSSVPQAFLNLAVRTPFLIRLRCPILLRDSCIKRRLFLWQALIACGYLGWLYAGAQRRGASVNFAPPKGTPKPGVVYNDLLWSAWAEVQSLTQPRKASGLTLKSLATRRALLRTLRLYALLGINSPKRQPLNTCTLEFQLTPPGLANALKRCFFNSLALSLTGLIWIPRLEKLTNSSNSPLLGRADF